MAWGIGGLFEQADREKFHKVLQDSNVPLPEISYNKVSVEKETIFDYYVCEKSVEWKLW